MGTKAISGHNGKQGRVFIGENYETELCVESWELTETAEEVETTNSCSAGQREYEYGITQVEGSFELSLDLSQHPYGNPPSLKPGSKVKARLFEHSNPASLSPTGSGTYWQFTELGIQSVRVSCPQTGKVSYSVNFKATANYTRPDENTTSTGV